MIYFVTFEDGRVVQISAPGERSAVVQAEKEFNQRVKRDDSGKVMVTRRP